MSNIRVWHGRSGDLYFAGKMSADDVTPEWLAYMKEKPTDKLEMLRRAFKTILERKGTPRG